MRVTLLRAWSSTSLFKKTWLLATLLVSVFERPEISEDDLRKLREQDVLSELMRELGEAMPALKRVLIDERDTYLTQKIGLDLERYRDDFDRNEGQAEEARRKPSEMPPRIAEDIALSRPFHNGMETFDMLRWAACSVLTVSGV